MIEQRTIAALRVILVELDEQAMHIVGLESYPPFVVETDTIKRRICAIELDIPVGDPFTDPTNETLYQTGWRR